ncbi:glycosyltransferase [Massilia sp. TWR1-2-2]|uniref:glycosyltransferase n=1 Tax=Massilia sp. TWR1-2-2 TaxID=2804584 RepID=UPI003CFAEF92
MRLVIDLQTCQGGDAATIRYHLAQVRSLARTAGSHELWLVLNGQSGERIESVRLAFDGVVPQQRIVVYDLPEHGAGAQPWQLRAAEQVRESAIAALEPDLVFVPNMFGDERMVASVGSLSDRFATLAGCSDLTPLLREAPPAGAPAYRQRTALSNATQLIVGSGEAAAVVEAALGAGHARVVPLGLVPQIVSRAGADADALDVLIHVSATHPGRAAMLLTAFLLQPEALRRGRRLVFIGATGADERSRMLAIAAGLDKGAGQLVFADGSSDAALQALYARAAVLVCASGDQSYGALEAMAAGVPVIAAQYDALAPLIGAPRALFDKPDAGAVGVALGQVLGDEALRQSLRQQGLALAARDTMDEHTRALWAAFDAAVALRPAAAPAPARRHRPRLAYVSPLPPERSGIADYSAELVPELARYYDIDLVVSQPAVGDAWIEANLPLRSVEWFDEHAHHYDRVLYHFGNSPMHQHMFGLLERHPGIVVLHDFYLGNIVHHLEHTGYVPGAFQQALYYSHGFAALADQRKTGINASVWKYPCNKALLDQASGVIVHARYPAELAERWYGHASVRKWRTLPLLRARHAGAGREAARAALTIAADEFVVCSFGLLGPTKRNDALLAAWLASPLAQDPDCRLVFVGAPDPGAYGRDFARQLEKAQCARPVEVTGFVSADAYRNWLAAADAGVQLRMQSRGETSAAVLDCLLYGVPAIANAHGSSAELPDDVLLKLPDDFAIAELADALVRLRGDGALRAALSARAGAFIDREHSPAQVGRQYVEAIEHFAGRGAGAELAAAVARIAPADADLTDVARAIGANSRHDGPRQLLVDISAMVQFDLRTGIQRVVRSVLKSLLEDTPAGFRVEPVYSAGGGAPYRYARRYMAGMLGIDNWQLDDAPVDAMQGDLFLGLDLATHGTRLNEGRLQQFRNRGVQVYFVVYDILPILRPEMFPPTAEGDFKAWLPMLARVADGLVCISRAVADEVAHYLGTLEAQQPSAPRRPLQIGWFHLGADIDASEPSSGLPPAAEDILGQLASHPTLLMVGTIEPRKGHAQALAAVELLWARGVGVNLVVVGKQGWMVESTVARLRDSAHAGKRLVWLEGASDEMLQKLYGSAQALLAASEGEGFGLPLIEAAQHGIAIIARDLPVFREVAGEHAYYFDGVAPAALADAIDAWLALHAAGKAPLSAGMPWLTWSAATAQLRGCILRQQWYRTLHHDAAAAPETIAAIAAVEAAPPPAAGTAARQLLVDVSAIVRTDLQSGIERVVRAQLFALLADPPPGWQVEPVFLNAEDDRWQYRYARKYAEKLRAGAGGTLEENLVAVSAGDVLYSPDYFPDGVAAAAAQGLYAKWRGAGVEVNFLVHDLLPLLRPEFFPERADRTHGRWLASIAANADRLVCISHAVAEETAAWLDRAGNPQPVSIAVLHHGADLAASVPTEGLPADSEATLAQLASAPVFLMVGTIEPRKGHLQALSAFEQLWREGSTAQLVIVGKEGWKGLPENQRRTIPHLMARLSHHPEMGERLLWLSGISDQYLERLYAVADCLLAPSEGEGFGLPLIEAAQCGLPILARDLPVCREVAREHACYFSGLAPADLARAVNEWLALDAAGQAPSSRNIEWSTWERNSRELVMVLSGGNDERRWVPPAKDGAPA